MTNSGSTFWVAAALKAADIPFVRTAPQALVRRNSRLSRLIEASARWVTGGWRDADSTSLGAAIKLSANLARTPVADPII